MEDTQSKYQELNPGEMVIKAGGGDYVKVPDGEPIKAHIDSVRVVDAKKFQSEEMVKKLAIGFKLDETDGEGQVYTAWFTPSLNPKSNLGKMATAAYGEMPTQVDPTEMRGLPVRIILSAPDKETGRQFIDSYLKPTTGQKRVEYDEVVVAVESDPLDDFEAAMDGLE